MLGGPEIWIKRDDLTGVPGGGNKTRKLEFVVADAIQSGARTLVSCGAVQSNHTRQTAAAAARVGLDCVLLHNNWAPPGAFYRQVGNPLLSALMGATLYYDPTERAIGDEGVLPQLVDYLRVEGRQPYLIPGGASEHPLGGLGYALCASEIVHQAQALDIEFDWIVHCTGSSSTQSGLLAGLTALGASTRVIGVADDWETAEKKTRVLRLANETLGQLNIRERVAPGAVEVVVADESPYGVAAPATLDAIRLLAQTEGLIADPVYEGKALRGLLDLVASGALHAGQRVLLLHLGGSPAVHGYAGQLWPAAFEELPSFGPTDDLPQILDT